MIYKTDEKMITRKDSSGVWKKSHLGIDIRDADRRQIADTRIRVSEFYKFRTCAFGGSKWRKYSYDCCVFAMYFIFYTILSETWTDITYYYWVQSDLWIRF